MTHPARRMEVLAAGFQEPATAAAAAAELRRVLDIGDGDLAIEEVAGDQEFVDGATIVLAGRIRESRLDEVETVLRRHGGVILTVVPERWTRPTVDTQRHEDDTTAASR
jgi:hypothetical protein